MSNEDNKINKLRHTLFSSIIPTVYKHLFHASQQVGSLQSALTNEAMSQLCSNWSLQETILNSDALRFYGSFMGGRGGNPVSP